MNSSLGVLIPEDLTNREFIANEIMNNMLALLTGASKTQLKYPPMMNRFGTICAKESFKMSSRM